MSPWSAWASALGGLGSGRRQWQQLDPHLQFRRRGGRHRLSPRSAFPGRPQCGLCRGQPVGRQLHGPRLDRHGERHRLRLVHPRRLLRRCPGGLRVFRQPDAAADPVPRPAAHRQRQHRRQPVPGADRDRLSHRPLRAGRRQHHAVRAPAGLDGDAECLLGMGRQFVEPQRGAADDQLAAHGVRRRPRRRHPARQRAQPRARPAPGLAARVCRRRPADHGGLRRRAVQRLHRLWRDARSATPR